MISSPFRRAGVGALALWAVMVQAAPPERITLTYELKRNGTVRVDVSETLEHDGRTYAITSEGRGRGILALFGILKSRRKGCGLMNSVTSAPEAGRCRPNSIGTRAR